MFFTSRIIFIQCSFREMHNRILYFMHRTIVIKVLLKKLCTFKNVPNWISKNLFFRSFYTHKKMILFFYIVLKKARSNCTLSIKHKKTKMQIPGHS